MCLTLWVQVTVGLMKSNKQTNYTNIYSKATFYVSKLILTLFSPSDIKCKEVKGFVRYIFTSLFYASKKEHLLNKEKCFLFHLESSFRSWDNRILNFRYSNVMTSSNAEAWNRKYILLTNLGSKHSLVMKFGQFM